MTHSLTQLEQCFDSLSPATENSDGTFAWFSDIPNPLFNLVAHLDSVDQIDSLIAKAPIGFPMSFWVHSLNKAEGLEDELKKRTFSSIGICPVMRWRVVPVKPVEGFEIRRIGTKPGENMDTFMEIMQASFHLDEQTCKPYRKLLENSNGEIYLVYFEGKAVGTGSIHPSGKEGHAGGVFNIATLPGYERKGLASAMTLSLMRRAYQQGLKDLVLYSAPGAAKLYEQLGFKTELEVEIYAKR